MWITNADRDLMVLFYEPKEQELAVIPNIRDREIKEYILYLDEYRLANYDEIKEAVGEVQEIMRAFKAGEMYYNPKDYELDESDRELAKQLVEKYRECFMPDDNTILERWANT